MINEGHPVLNFLQGYGFYKVFGHLWFMYILFLIECFILLLIPQIDEHVIAITVISGIASILFTVYGFNTFWCRLALYLFWFLLGYLLERSNVSDKIENGTNAIVVVVVSCILFLLIWYIIDYRLSADVLYIKIIKEILAIVEAGVGFLLVCMMSILLVRNASHFKTPYKFLTYCGIRSFDIYIVHYPFITGAFFVLLKRLFGSQGFLIGFLTALSSLIIIVAIIVICHRLLNFRRVKSN